jgi:DNA-binding NtrC family response regulator
VNLLRKPYGRDALANKIRNVLSTREPPSLRILLVEDDDDLRSATEEMLSSLGHRVVGVGTGATARSALAGDTFDVLLTDRHLPDGSGIDVASAATAENPRLRVVIASGDASAADVGGAVLLPKPYGFDELERALGGVTARTL